jgi:hypothetical protein
MATDFQTFLNEDGSVSNLLDQVVYIVDELENTFFVKTLNRPDWPSPYLSRLLLTLAILNRSGFLANSTTSSVTINADSYESIFVYSQESANLIRNNDVFQARWMRNQSGYYNYLVV